MKVLFLQGYPSATVSCSMKPNFRRNRKSVLFRPNSPKNDFNKPAEIYSPKVPARDIVINFGRHKGKMLGTLPSRYLRWISENRRTRGDDAWAKRADQVLADPIYGDRIEWEFADRILRCDDVADRFYANDGEEVVPALMDIAERFGWAEWSDDRGWSKVKLEFLGTSKGGRLPRKTDVPENKKEVMLKREKKATDVDELDGGRRAVRRERLRMKRGGPTLAAVEETAGLGFGANSEEEKLENGVGIEVDGEDEVVSARNEDPTVKTQSRFPGREWLLKTALDLKSRRRL